MRCPFVRAVHAGDLPRAAELAAAGPDPADPVTVPLLILWAQRMADGATPEEAMA